MKNTFVTGFICLLGLSLLAEVIDIGAGQTLDRGCLTGGETVEVKSGTVALALDKQYYGTLRASGGTVELTALGQSEDVTVTARCVADAGQISPEGVPFVVRQSDACDWFTVTPDKGVLLPGVDTTFHVDFKASVMTNRHYYKGAFYVAMTNGLTRPVSITAETDFVPPFYAAQEGEVALYAELDNPISGSYLSGEAEYGFDVAVSNVYYFMIHGAAASSVKIQAAVDDNAYAQSVQQVRAYPTWTMITPGKAFGDYLAPFVLTPGRHRIRIKVPYATFPYDGLVLTDSPGSFEPR